MESHEQKKSEGKINDNIWDHLSREQSFNDREMLPIAVFYKKNY